MTDANANAIRALEALYRTFARYPLRARIVGCPHCVGQKDDAPLHRAPLRALRAADLGSYAFKAMTTWGDVDDYRHFLPRILDLSLDRPPEPGLEPAQIADKLRYAGWSTWPEDEQKAITEFVMATFQAALAWHPDIRAESSPRPCWEVWDALEFAATAHGDVSMLLAAWPMQGNASLLHFADLVLRWAEQSHELERVAGLKLRRFLLDATKISILEAVFAAYFDEPWSCRIAEAVDVLVALGPAPP
ncbi:hypothetical protein [Polyangium sp. 6x1]|uniref:hypothetical protein n=1 Tax=Polyangium sp. 6x1 TaxID=3042689 RepID=UPI0024832DEB|nr:hypothetical protein [Polyangium sp. 6x1]MDI1443531.1 hypothetical protein [Polyangium sp. 6x1]